PAWSATPACSTGSDPCPTPRRCWPKPAGTGTTTARRHAQAARSATPRCAPIRRPTCAEPWNASAPAWAVKPRWRRRFPRWAEQGASAHVRRDEVPVHQVPERLDVLRPRVAVVDVVRVFPHIAGQQRGVLAGHRVDRVGGAGQGQRTVLALHQPGPAGTEGLHRQVAELFLERGEVAEGLVD